jgi:hypothetical protein
MADVGTNKVSFDYEGDTNFLPQSIKWDVLSVAGAATILGSAERSAPTTAAVHVRMSGSPMAAPGGTVFATVTGTAIKSATVPLTNGQAELTIANVPAGAKTVTISYSGDAHYKPGTQGLRISEGRQRSVNH